MDLSGEKLHCRVFEQCRSFFGSRNAKRSALVFYFGLVALLLPWPAQSQLRCQHIFAKTRQVGEATPLAVSDITQAAREGLERVPEFQFIREAARERGLRVWLFGGTAASYLRYVKWDLLRRTGQLNLQVDRFDYDYTNIFRSTQDLDIVVDSTPQKAKEFEQLLKQKFPHFLGSKANKWEVRSLTHSVGRPGEHGYKEALLNDRDFSLQNTDSNSVAMVELTSDVSRTNGPLVRDLRSWNEPPERSQFLNDTLHDEISYFRSPRHFETARARLGENPEILSAIRVLVKAFQYEAKLPKDSEAEIRKVIQEFNPRVVKNEAALRRIKDTAEKLIKHAVNLEYAINKLDDLGLRKKLISMGDPTEEDSIAWWLNKEPLRSKPLGQGSGRTARELGIETVAHETRSFLAYESITRAHSGEPNVLISRKGVKGEGAALGNGFYVRKGRKGAVGSGLTIRFRLNPNAREGEDADFIQHDDIVLILNKRALEVIPESLNFGLKELVEIARGKRVLKLDHSDRALVEKFKRRLNIGRLKDELEKRFPTNRLGDVKGLAETVILLTQSHGENPTRDFLPTDVRQELINLALSRLHLALDLSHERHLVVYLRAMGPLLAANTAPGLDVKREFETRLASVLLSESVPASFKRVAIEELLLINDHSAISELERLPEIERIKTETAIKGWSKSRDPRKREAHENFNEFVLDRVMDGASLEEVITLTKNPMLDLDFQSSARTGAFAWAKVKYQPLLTLLVEKNRIDILKYLIGERGVDPNWQNQETGETLLHRAIKEGQNEILAYLQSFKSIDFNRPDKNGETPLFLLSGVERNIIDQVLSDSRIDFTLLNKAGQTWLHAMSISALHSVVGNSLKRRPDLDLNLKNRDGDTVLLATIREADLNRNGYTGAAGDVAFILQLPVDPTVRDRDGLTALELAFSKGPFSHVVSQLLDYEASWRMKSLSLDGFETFTKIKRQIGDELERKFRKR